MGLVLISAAAAAVGYVLTEIALRFFAVTSLSVAFLSNITGGLSLLIPTLRRPDAWRGWSRADWLRLIAAALAMFALAFVLLYTAIGRIGSSKVSLLGRLEVIFVIFLAVVFLGEHWSRRRWVASFLALGGVPGRWLHAHPIRQEWLNGDAARRSSLRYRETESGQPEPLWI